MKLNISHNIKTNAKREPLRNIVHVQSCKRSALRQKTVYVTHKMKTNIKGEQFRKIEHVQSFKKT